MKNTILLIIFVFTFISLSLGQNKDETLNNESIISLCKIGLSPSIIISKIENSKSSFATDTDALINLKGNNVPDEVIKAMIEAGYSSAKDSGDKKNPEEHQKSGIYLFQTIEDSQELVELEPSTTSQTKSSMIGFGKSGTSVKLSSTMARLQTAEKNPIFYFYFDETTDIHDQFNYFRKSTSPADFTLVKFTTNASSRGMVTMSMSSFGGVQQGIPDKQMIPFDFEKTETGIYKVWVNTPLVSGEYCFLHSSAAQRQYSGISVYDFGISEVKIVTVDEKGNKRYQSEGIMNPVLRDSVNSFLGYKQYKDDSKQIATTVIYNRNSILSIITKGEHSDDSGSRKFSMTSSFNLKTMSPLYFRDIFNRKYVGDIKERIIKEAKKQGCEYPKKFDLSATNVSVDSRWFYFDIGCNCGYPECEDIQKPILILFGDIDQFMLDEGLIPR